MGHLIDYEIEYNNVNGRFQEISKLLLGKYKNKYEELLSKVENYNVGYHHIEPKDLIAELETWLSELKQNT